jgi:hypothetical protein
MRAYTFALGVAAALAASSALAHGPQIQITNVSNKIVTRNLIPAGSYGTSLTAPKSVYVLPIQQVFSGSPTSDFWSVLPNSTIDPITHVSEYQFGPGLAYGYGHTFDSGQHFNVDFTDALLRWNGSSFAANPGPEEIGALRGDSTSAADTAFTTDSGPYQGLVFGSISSTYNAESHSSMRFRVLGDGSSALVEPADGIYLLKFQISSTQPQLMPSDDVSLVLHKNASSEALGAAVASLGADPAFVQYVAVPEPATATLLLTPLATCLLGVWRRRRGD